MTAATPTPFAFPFNSFNADSFTSFFGDTEPMGAFARGAMVASTESTRASVKGMQDAGQTMMAHLKDQMTLSVETGKKLADAQSIEDAMTIQTGFVKKAFENNLRSFSELTELYADTMREAFAPLAKQAKKAAKTTKSS
ncbi:MAG: phasin family protein [Pseudomonadota bacterium]